jgi:hypothetical protein
MIPSWIALCRDKELDVVNLADADAEEQLVKIFSDDDKRRKILKLANFSTITFFVNLILVIVFSLGAG